ncbi:MULTISPECIES: hypothetical protein [Streptomyces]|uniref:hypothetical protein n=1 Tax=Streptomyces TaxID=1883 RepID=UPI001C435B97|nr:hypothetical protein [Streptomyces radiopugnans]URN11104.1 hypothetical protein LUW77_01280 [Streptomyces radiopugnans]
MVIAALMAPSVAATRRSPGSRPRNRGRAQSKRKTAAQARRVNAVPIGPISSNIQVETAAPDWTLIIAITTRPAGPYDLVETDLADKASL